MKRVLVRRALASAAAAELHLPRAKLRSPTAVLEALRSATIVEKDATAGPFVLVDDPALQPNSAQGRRSFMLAKELGRRAAREIVLEWPELFEYDVSDPPMRFYPGDEEPRPVDDRRSSEEDLRKAIADGRHRSAAIIYHNGKEEGVELDEETRLQALELFAFSTSDGSESTVAAFADSDWPMERFHREAIGLSGPPVWDRTGLAEEIFASLQNPSGRAYTAMIAGAGKRGAGLRAWELYDAAKEAGVSLGLAAYRGLIGHVLYRTEGVSGEAWELALQLTKEAAEAGLAPDIHLFNALLRQLDQLRVPEKVKTARSVMEEVLRLGLRPTPATYLQLIRLHASSNQLPDMINQSLAALEAQAKEEGGLKFTTEEDAEFLGISGAMEIIEGSLKPLDQFKAATLANRLHRLLEAQEGADFGFVSAEAEEAFFNGLLHTNLSAAGEAEFFAVYDRVVPARITPYLQLLSELLDMIIVWGAWGRLPQVWEELCSSGKWLLPSLVKSLGRALDTAVGSLDGLDEPEEAETLRHNVCAIVTSWLELMLTQYNQPWYTPQSPFKSENLVIMALAAAKSNDLELAWRLCDIWIKAAKNPVPHRSRREEAKPSSPDGEPLSLELDTGIDHRRFASLAAFFIEAEAWERVLALFTFAQEQRSRPTDREIRRAFQGLSSSGRLAQLSLSLQQRITAALEQREPEEEAIENLDSDEATGLNPPRRY